MLADINGEIDGLPQVFEEGLVGGFILNAAGNDQLRAGFSCDLYGFILSLDSSYPADRE